jgi:heme-degrading monooxygenase HmoA
MFGALIDKARAAGLLSSKVYRSEADPDDVLFVSEWRSHEDLHKFGEENGDRFNEVAGVKPEDWEDLAWGLSDARSF